MKRFLTSLLFCIAFSLTHAQQLPDSLRTLFRAKDDSTKAKQIVGAADELKTTYKEFAYVLTDSALALSKRIKFLPAEALAYKIKGILADNDGQYNASVSWYLKAIEDYRKMKDEVGVARCEANIGIILRNTKKYAEAMDYFRQSIAVFQQHHFDRGVMICDENLGICKMYLNEFDSAEYFFLQAEAIMNRTGSIDPMVWGNLGNVYSKKKEYAKAEGYFQQCVDYYNKNAPTDFGLSVWLQNMAGNYIAEKKYALALPLLERVRTMNADHFYTRENTYVYEDLMRCYQETGNTAKALECAKTLMKIRDTIYNSDNLLQLNEMKTQFETEKKELQIDNLKKEKALKDVEIDRKAAESRNFALGLIAALILLIVSAVMIYQKIRSNRVISEQKQLVEVQKAVVEEKNKEILDSIHYAKRIQGALLATDEMLQRNLPEYFVLYLPKDIVSGDFYWATEKDGNFFLAVCDSTGHGVPGAFMSLLNSSFLNEAITEKNMTAPGAIFDHTRTRLLSHLSENESQDGMDGILLRKSANVIEYAAAYNNPVLLRDGMATELSADRMPVGKSHGAVQPFRTFRQTMQRGDMLYLFTDGYADQFGGPDGKKFRHKQLLALLQEIHRHPAEEQKRLLLERFSAWKGALEQVDDILIAGIRF